MQKPYPALCKDCKHGAPEEESSWNLKCHHPIVNANDAYALANAGLRGGGTDCSSERSKKGWFVNCGMVGKLWEAK
jgi:hypothetical protein